MKIRIGLSMCALLAAAVLVNAGEKDAAKVDSGLKSGDFVAPFNVFDVTGSEKGTSLCYRCKFGGRPVVSIFTRSLDDNVVALIQDVDKQVAKGKDKGLSAFVVYLTDDPDAAEKDLAKVAEKNKIANVPLTIFDGEAGPPEYKLAEKAETTVLMWTGGKVKVNQGFAKGTLKKAKVKTVAGQTSKILD